MQVILIALLFLTDDEFKDIFWIFLEFDLPTLSKKSNEKIEHPPYRDQENDVQEVGAEDLELGSGCR
jgi:hypothetical protein